MQGSNTPYLKSMITALLMLCPLVAYAVGEAPDDVVDFKLALDTSWVVLTGILVFFMQAGFALIETGMTRSKNAVNVMMKNYLGMCVSSIVFWLVGYGLMFGFNPSGWLGKSHFAPMDMLSWDWSVLFFQMMFAGIATTIASGAMAERTHFKGYLIGACLITGLIYPMMGSWAWGSFHGGRGWLAEMGFIDFAGSTVVHSIGGWCALAGIIVIGARTGKFANKGKVHHIAGHNLPMVTLGGFILWFAWFGFNAGSTLEANGLIGKIVINTHLSACASVLCYLLLCRLRKRPIFLTKAVNASLGGLVAISAGCATMNPVFALVTGAIAGGLTVFGSWLMNALHLDDAVDAVTVHAFCGVWGTLSAGLFFAGDLFDGGRVMTQMTGIITAFIWGFSASLIGYWIIQQTVGLRVSPLEEQRGLDYSEHAEIAYPDFQDDMMYDQDILEQKRLGKE